MILTIIKRVGDKAHKMDLLADMNISYTFNIGYLTLYIEDEDEGNEYLRANPLQGREVDVE